MKSTALPTEPKPIRMDPELANEVDKILKPLKGADLERAHEAVMKVYHSTTSGSFEQIFEAYRSAIEEAVTAP